MSVDVTKKALVLFYFSYDTARMGPQCAYLLGIDPSNVNAIYQGMSKECFSNGELVEEHETGYTIYPDLVLYRNTNLDGDSYMIKRLMGGRKLQDFVVNSGVDAGMGNWGICIGTHEVATCEEYIAGNS